MNQNDTGSQINWKLEYKYFKESYSRLLQVLSEIESNELDILRLNAVYKASLTYLLKSTFKYLIKTLRLYLEFKGLLNDDGSVVSNEYIIHMASKHGLLIEGILWITLLSNSKEISNKYDGEFSDNLCYEIKSMYDRIFKSAIVRLDEIEAL